MPQYWRITLLCNVCIWNEIYNEIYLLYIYTRNSLTDREIETPCHTKSFKGVFIKHTTSLNFKPMKTTQIGKQVWHYQADPRHQLFLRKLSWLYFPGENDILLYLSTAWLGRCTGCLHWQDNVHQTNPVCNAIASTLMDIANSSWPGLSGSKQLQHQG